MNGPTILLVSSSARDVNLITSALNALGLSRPVVVPDGETAVLWVAANDCGVCLLDYRLPGIDGLEALVRMRARRPDLPVIFLSDAASEQAAINAFHTGVVDYVPKTAGYQSRVAQLTRDVLREQAGNAPAAVTQASVDPSVPRHLIQPTYQNRLRVIGRQLDLYRYHSVHLLEVGGGFLVRAIGSDPRAPEALEFPDRDFPQHIAGAVAARGQGERQHQPRGLLPTGYEDFLRAIGHRMDIDRAQAITVSELGQYVVVGGIGRTDGRTETTLGPFQTLMNPDDVAYILNEAYRRRTGQNNASGKSLFARIRG
jgi:CheY-like chemotaxis protein